MLTTNCQEYINRMAGGAAIMRIGDIWYGADEYAHTDDQVTINGIYTFSNKRVNLIQTLRTESAMSFTSSMPGGDSISVEIIVNNSRFRSHVQRLLASELITPVLPVMNPVIAMYTTPARLNQDFYRQYGFEPNDIATNDDAGHMYASVPIMMYISNLRISTIEEHPYDKRLSFQLSKVLTKNIYGDATLYCKSLDDAFLQHNYLNTLMSVGGDTRQIDVFAEMMGMKTADMRKTIDTIKTYTEFKNRYTVNTDTATKREYY